jgi:hypothetical protein
VPAGDEFAIARETDAFSYNTPDAKQFHAGEPFNVDAFLTKYGLGDPVLTLLATMVGGADTSRLDMTPQSAGLYVLSLGMSFNYVMLQQGLVVETYFVPDASSPGSKCARGRRRSRRAS